MKVVDLFAGAGGMSKGAELAGLDVVAAFDHWEPAVETYKANFDHAAIQADLGKVEEVVPRLQALEPEMVVGGPPCQDFSHAGGDPRALVRS